MSTWRTTATVSTRLHARRSTGLTVADSEESFTRTESVASWSREGWVGYEAEREALLYVFIFLFFDRCKVFQSDIKLFHKGAGIFVLFNFFGSFSLFSRCCYCAVLCFLFPCQKRKRLCFVQQYIQQARQKRKRITLPRVCTYVRYVSERRGPRTSGNRPRREAYMASELYFPEAWRGAWHYQVASLQLRSIMKELYSIMDLCPLCIVI